jgi:hypothetical protein
LRTRLSSRRSDQPGLCNSERQYVFQQ